MKHNNIAVLNYVLAGLPLPERTAALACSIVEANPGAMPAVAALFDLAVVMASQLNATQRAALSCYAHESAEAIEGHLSMGPS